MRIAQISAPALVALATAGCAQQHADYYALDSVTHQPVAVVQRYTPAAHAKPRYVQPSYAQAQERSYGHPEQAPYPPPNHGAAATYTAVAQSNPFQQARWY